MLKPFFFSVACIATPLWAEPPKVAVDIAPVHALVSQVLSGVGTADLVVSPTASPRSYALRPSQAQALSQSDLVVWIGPELTPWLIKPLSTLASDAVILELLAADETIILVYREADEVDEDGDHDHGHDHDHDHSGGADPHAWLDPENARIWLGLIAETLAEIDPQNATLYRDNADKAQGGIDALSAELSATLEPVKNRPFVTFHDAYHYFEDRFGLNFAGAVSLSDASDPSPAQLSHPRDTLVEKQVRCAFREPQFDDRLLRAASEGGALQIEVLDPLGSGLEPGPGLYARLLRDMAQSLASCR